MRWNEIVIEARDKDGNWISGSYNPNFDDEHIQATKELGLDDRYTGSHSKLTRPDDRYAVDNPLPKTDKLSFEDGLALTQKALDKLGLRPSLKTIQVNPADLYSTQDYINPMTVSQNLKFTTGKPLVTEIDGQIIILDGNHKVLAALKNGQDVMDVSYLPIGEV